MPSHTLVLALGGIISREHGQPSPGPFELAMADGALLGAVSVKVDGASLYNTLILTKN
jgi:hypothetical protein